MAAPPGHASDTRAYNLAHGRVVFQEHCLRCHEQGHLGAPVVGKPDDWSSRIDQPLDLFIKHAIEGHGEMPARGDSGLADREIASAVAYVVSRARIVLSEQAAAPEEQGAAAAPVRLDSSDGTVVQMFLLLLSKDRWK